MFTWTEAFVACEWLLRLIMLIYVPQKRSPAAARTWLLLIFLEPFIGLTLYACFGRPYLSRRRIEMQKQFTEIIRKAGHAYFGPYLARPEMPAQFIPTVTLAEQLGDFPTLGGNSLEFLPDYQDAISRLVADIDVAMHHVHLLYYIFADDATGNQVADAVIRAAGRGVTCRVMIDSIGEKTAWAKLVPRMQAAGVEVCRLLPPRIYNWFQKKATRLDLRNHRKIAVIDAQIAYVGSQNIVNADFKRGLIFEELVARVTGPVVMQLQAVFMGDRFFEVEQRVNVAEQQALYHCPGRTGETPAQVLPSGPGYPQANNLRLIVDLLHAAEKRVVITTPYFIPDEALLQALQTAVLRGVEVHLVVCAQPDQLLVGLAQRSYYEALLDAGARIHLYKERFLHAKHMSVDDAIVLIGSSNMDIRSFTLNAEISLLVYDAKVALELRKIQDRYFAGSTLLTAEEWQRRPLWVKTFQNMARLMDSVL